MILWLCLTVFVTISIATSQKKYQVILTRSLNETLRRTFMTSITTLLALGSIYLFGGAVLADFALAMIWGVDWYLFINFCSCWDSGMV